MNQLVEIVAEASAAVSKSARRMPRRVERNYEEFREQAQLLIRELLARLEMLTRSEREKRRGISGLRRRASVQHAARGAGAEDDDDDAASSPAEVTELAQQLKELKLQMEQMAQLNMMNFGGPSTANSDVEDSEDEYESEDESEEDDSDEKEDLDEEKEEEEEEEDVEQGDGAAQRIQNYPTSGVVCLPAPPAPLEKKSHKKNRGSGSSRPKSQPPQPPQQQPSVKSTAPRAPPAPPAPAAPLAPPAPPAPPAPRAPPAPPVSAAPPTARSPAFAIVVENGDAEDAAMFDCPPPGKLSTVDEAGESPSMSLADELRAVQLRKTSTTGDEAAALSDDKPLKKLKVYTRNIPHSENLNFSQMIKLSAKIKLRKTEVPRSPGGTPLKRTAASNPHMEMLKNALFNKFRGALGNSPPTKSARHRRMSSRIDVDDEEWASDKEN